MSGPEIKHALRKIEFPSCAREALLKIEQLICGRVPSIKHMDLALDLLAEFVFCETDRRGNKRHEPLTPLLELQLLAVLFEYFNSKSANEAAKNTIFLSLFSGTTANLRLPVLTKFVSIAIGTQSSSVLTSASTWMQQLGNTSVNSCKLAEAVVRDYFVLLPTTPEQLKTLPSIAPQFTANFLTAVAEIYYSNGKNYEIMYPSRCLLEIITFWIKENTRLCVAGQQIESALPPGAIAMEATTPIAGLIKWCVLAPLHDQDSDLYSQLHLSLLDSILGVPSTNPARAVSAQHLTAPCGNIIRFVAELHKKNKGETGYDKQGALKSNCSLQLALDRLAQAVQVCFSAGCVYGNLDDLVNQLQQLPKTKLLDIVMNTYQENKLVC